MKSKDWNKILKNWKNPEKSGKQIDIWNKRSSYHILKTNWSRNMAKNAEI